MTQINADPIMTFLSTYERAYAEEEHVFDQIRFARWIVEKHPLVAEAIITMVRKDWEKEILAQSARC